MGKKVAKLIGQSESQLGLETGDRIRGHPGSGFQMTRLPSCTLIRHVRPRATRAAAQAKQLAPGRDASRHRIVEQEILGPFAAATLAVGSCCA
jgi:hypothetical protein